MIGFVMERQNRPSVGPRDEGKVVNKWRCAITWTLRCPAWILRFLLRGILVYRPRFGHDMSLGSRLEAQFSWQPALVRIHLCPGSLAGNLWRILYPFHQHPFCSAGVPANVRYGSFSGQANLALAGEFKVFLAQSIVP